MTTQPTVIYFRESLLQSVLSDTYSVLMLAGLLYANHNWLGDYGLVAFLMTVLFLISLVGRSMSKSKRFYSMKEFKDYVSGLSKFNHCGKEMTYTPYGNNVSGGTWTCHKCPVTISEG